MSLKHLIIVSNLKQFVTIVNAGPQSKPEFMDTKSVEFEKEKRNEIQFTRNGDDMEV